MVLFLPHLGLVTAASLPVTLAEKEASEQDVVRNLAQRRPCVYVLGAALRIQLVSQQIIPQWQGEMHDRSDHCRKFRPPSSQTHKFATNARADDFARPERH